MTSFPDTKQIQEALSSAKTVLIVLPTKVNFDQVAAGLACFLSLKKSGKEAMIVCPELMTVRFSSLIGVDKIQTGLGGRNLVISFDYLKDSIEKVSYNIENNKFNLTIQPKSGFPPLSTEKVQYHYRGGQTDLVIMIGVRSFEDLGRFYEDNRDLFTQVKTVDLDIYPRQKTYAKMGFFDLQSASFL